MMMTTVEMSRIHICYTNIVSPQTDKVDVISSATWKPGRQTEKHVADNIITLTT